MKSIRWCVWTLLAFGVTVGGVQAGEPSPFVNDAIVLSAQGVCFGQEGKGGPITEGKILTSAFTSFCTNDPNALLVYDIDDGSIKVINQCGFILCTLATPTVAAQCAQESSTKSGKTSIRGVCVVIYDMLGSTANGGAKSEVNLQVTEGDVLLKGSYEASVHFLAEGTPCTVVFKGKKLFAPNPETCKF